MVGERTRAATVRAGLMPKMLPTAPITDPAEAEAHSVKKKRERSPDTQVDRIRSKVVHETPAAYRNMSLSGGMRSSLALPEAGEYAYPRTMASGIPSVLPITSSAAAASSSATASTLASIG